VVEVFAECRPIGGIITFEINTNPTILDEGDLVNQLRRRVTESFLTSMSTMFADALR
jgi:hypothetical protein